VRKARGKIDLSQVSRVGVDETSSLKRHKATSLFVDLDTRQLIFATEGRGKDTFDEFVKELEARGGRKENIKVLCMDMSGSFISGYFEHFSHASLVFDKFYIVKMLKQGSR
jgi:Transposase and inactivated derivatives